jgi:trimeric autotransporter adhesin
MLFDSLRQRMIRMTRRLAGGPTVRRGRLPCKPRLEALEDRWLPSTIVVTNVNDAGAGSLRQAILDSNANPGSDEPNVIAFNILGTGVHTIFVGSTTHQPLPAIIAAVDIDGTTQPGAAVNTLSVGDNAVLKIELDGSKLGPGFNGLDFTGGGSGVAGLMIDNFRPTTGASPVGGNAILMEDNGDDELIIGNFLGLHGSGGAGTFSNGSDVTVDIGSSFNNIGGTAPNLRNILSGAGAGVTITSTDGPEFNVVQGNYIGTDPTGTRAVANANGVVDSGTHTTIGLADGLGAGNVISGNLRAGVDLSDAVDDLTDGNLIGVNAAGTALLTNGGFGVLASGGSGGVIGGTAAGAANVIGGDGIGIELTDAGAPAGTNGYQVQGNFIGTDATVTHNFGGDVGIFLEGSVATQGVANTTIAGNIIDNQSQVGVDIFGVSAKNNVVQGNFIGTDPTGKLARGNGIGVEVAHGANKNIIGIGGTGGGAGNVIAHNTGAGVVIGSSLTDVATVGNTVRGNSIFANGFGIALGNDGVIPNRTVNPSPGPNNFQNVPVLTSATDPVLGRTVVEGSLKSAPNATFVIDFYSSATADKSGFGQGQFYLGREVVTTNESGTATIDFVVTPGTLWGNVITATATDVGGDTSEFSKAVTVQRIRFG